MINISATETFNLTKSNSIAAFMTHKNDYIICQYTSTVKLLYHDRDYIMYACF